MHRRAERCEANRTVRFGADRRDGFEHGPIDDDRVLLGRLRIGREKRIQHVMYRQLLMTVEQDGFRTRRPDIDPNRKHTITS